MKDISEERSLDRFFKDRDRDGQSIILFKCIGRFLKLIFSMKRLKLGNRSKFIIHIKRSWDIRILTKVKSERSD